MAKLKRILTHPRKNESGQGALAIVLILLMLGAVILTPLLVFMSTGLKAGGVYESKLQEFYAADAGVEDAIWKIKDGNSSVPVYSLDEEVNDRNVNVTIQEIVGGVYKINSTATSDGGGNTTIECYVLNIGGFNLFDNAITSNGTVDIKGNVNGSIVAVDCGGTPNCTTNTTINWPSEVQLSAYYWDQVKNLEPPFPYNHPMDIAGTNTTIEALYRDGPLNIYNSLNTPATLTLNGTVYITGDLKIGTEKQDFTLNLNNQTIYCESTTEKWAIEVGGKCTIIGSGCIIAVGGIYFGPKGDVGSEDDFVFIMSVEDWVWLQPVGNFYGSVAGNANINLWPNTNLTWTASGGGENFPTEGMGMMKVLSYTIN